LAALVLTSVQPASAQRALSFPVSHSAESQLLAEPLVVEADSLRSHAAELVFVSTLGAGAGLVAGYFVGNALASSEGGYDGVLVAPVGATLASGLIAWGVGRKYGDLNAGETIWLSVLGSAVGAGAFYAAAGSGLIYNTPALVTAFSVGQGLVTGLGANGLIARRARETLEGSAAPRP